METIRNVVRSRTTWQPVRLL